MASLRPLTLLARPTTSSTGGLLRLDIACYNLVKARQLSTSHHQNSQGAIDFIQLKESLLSRTLPTHVEALTSTNAQKLANSLQTFIPDWSLPFHSSLQSKDTAESVRLPPAWHLIHFNPALPSNRLLPDGTDPAQSPGEPFVRRMWAGGFLKFGDKKQPALDGRYYECRESIGSVDIKGEPGKEKIFVGIDRKVFGPGDEEFVHERRNIVFLREQTDSAKAAGAPPRTKSSFGKPEKEKESTQADDSAESFSHTLLPTPTLLFRYSALTFNAHLIHLDTSYCRNIEGHRNLLFHGPLSLTLLTTYLNGIIRARYEPLDSQGNPVSKPGEEEWYIKEVEYRNVAPLYCDEPLTLFVKRVETPNVKPKEMERNEPKRGLIEEAEKIQEEKEDEKIADKMYKLWIEGPNGAVAVRAMAKVSKREGPHNYGAKETWREAIGTGIVFGGLMSVFD